ncbi:acylase [Sphingomonas sp. HDW15A]|uniref:penicillin acylase family protein n=1 Tax=Sphingomonas sp. HDW15A TaxID=2714942 RepID=UPI00140D6508|nr:penicillin acylase family protein [Sphingomonas sp. HDW15A]QIK97062.1 acylase [Sphingomonas sp. HDW15A]
MKIWLGLISAALLAAPATTKMAPSEPERLAARAANVTIIRDPLGIAHVRGGTDADAVFGMIYAQAEDDFNRVETNYLASLGRLAEAEGEKALWKDVRQRLWIDHDALRAKYRSSPQWLRKLMDAWADGLNYYLVTHPEVKPRVLTHFEPWMALSFSEGSIGGDIEYVDVAALEALYDDGAARRASIMPWGEPAGSNGIAIGPTRSASGNPLLLINPHTSFFFRDVVQMTSGEGLNAYGAVTWGQFFIYQGFNEKAGWMHTSSGLDNRDEFAVTFARMANGKLGYRYGSDVRPVGLNPITLRVRQPDGTLATRTITTFRTMHGPIVRSENGRFIAFAIMDEPAKALEQSFRRTKATSLKQFMEVSALRANSSNNTLFADSSGNFAYLHPQFVPLRDHRFKYRGVVDGSDPRTGWRGLHDIDSLPNVINPKSGFVFNVNDAPWPAAGKGTLDPRRFPAYMDQWGWNPRTDHALAVLSGQGKFTAEDLRAAAYDTANPGFDRLLPPLFAAYAALPRSDSRRRSLQGPITLLKNWDRRWRKDSEALSLAVNWAEIMWEKALGTDRPPNDEEVGYGRMIAAPANVQLETLTEAVAKMRDLYGDWRVKWGDINRFQRNDGSITQTFDDKKPSIAVGFPSARWGTLASFGAQTYPGTKKRYGTSGNSFVAVVEFTPTGPKAMAVTAGGVNGDPASPHFTDQAQAYADGRLLPVPFDAREIAAQAVEAYRPGEARRTR